MQHQQSQSTSFQQSQQCNNYETDRITIGKAYRFILLLISVSGTWSESTYNTLLCEHIRLISRLYGANERCKATHHFDCSPCQSKCSWFPCVDRRHERRDRTDTQPKAGCNTFSLSVFATFRHNTHRPMAGNIIDKVQEGTSKTDVISFGRRRETTFSPSPDR